MIPVWFYGRRHGTNAGKVPEKMQEGKCEKVMKLQRYKDGLRIIFSKPTYKSPHCTFFYNFFDQKNRRLQKPFSDVKTSLIQITRPKHVFFLLFNWNKIYTELEPDWFSGRLLHSCKPAPLNWCKKNPEFFSLRRIRENFRVVAHSKNTSLPYSFLFLLRMYHLLCRLDKAGLTTF